MPKFTYDDFYTFEKSSATPTEIEDCISNLMVASMDTRAKVDSVNQHTGEYRIILQGTLSIDKGRRSKDNS